MEGRHTAASEIPFGTSPFSIREKLLGGAFWQFLDSRRVLRQFRNPLLAHSVRVAVIDERRTVTRSRSGVSGLFWLQHWRVLRGARGHVGLYQTRPNQLALRRRLHPRHPHVSERPAPLLLRVALGIRARARAVSSKSCETQRSFAASLVVPESPRFLASRGRAKEVGNWFKRACAVNRVKIAEIFPEGLEDGAKLMCEKPAATNKAAVGESSRRQSSCPDTRKARERERERHAKICLRH